MPFGLHVYSDYANPHCQTCGGLGFVMVNPVVLQNPTRTVRTEAPCPSCIEGVWT